MFLSVSVFSNRGWTRQGIDCTNRGISSKYDDGYIAIGENDPPATHQGLPVYIMRETKSLYGTYYYAVPVAVQATWTMMGGNFLYTSDSRFPHRYPLPIHDRIE